MSKKHFSLFYKNCQFCGSKDNKHYALGLCIRCYSKLPQSLKLKFKKANDKLRGQYRKDQFKVILKKGSRSQKRYWNLEQTRTVSFAYIKTLKEKTQFCGICLTGMNDWEKVIDHSLGWERGGKTEIGNLAVVHRTCNALKGKLTPEEYAIKKYKQLLEQCTVLLAVILSGKEKK